jgi:hypothetical protein
MQLLCSYGHLITSRSTIPAACRSPSGAVPNAPSRSSWETANTGSSTPATSLISALAQPPSSGLCAAYLVSVLAPSRPRPNFATALVISHSRPPFAARPRSGHCRIIVREQANGARARQQGAKGFSSGRALGGYLGQAGPPDAAPLAPRPFGPVSGKAEIY